MDATRVFAMDSMAICRAVMAVDSSSWCYGLERFEISVQLTNAVGITSVTAPPL